ncbi:MAG: DEAD/DEAH box helicase [Rickettsiales bacterium]|nr:DEAD/DEAH box helicase [Rickettsiales bacterium]
MTDLVKFRELGLSDAMIECLHKKGFEEPTPIQAKTIPFLLSSDLDLIGKAQTGTGKTAAFGIPIVEKITSNAGHVQTLIMAPTRELAIQVTEELSSFCEGKKIKVIAIYGGQPIERQISRLNRGVDIVVGTPGRILDHISRKTLNIAKIQHIVLDEADEMLNMGFIDDIEEILKSAPQDRRTILFSATMPSHIEKLAKNYMKNYEIISVASEQIGRDNIQQIYFEVSQSDKFEALFRIIDVEQSFYGVVFCRTKIDVDEIASKLSNRGCRAEALHGDLSQNQREKILSKFKNKRVTVLVATDVAARGIDIDNLTHVINYALPQDPESYVHRIGRTGRAGKSGTAITLITPSEYRKLTSIQRIANTKITKQKVPNIEEVIESKKQRIKSDLEKIIKDNNFDDLNEVASEILNENDDPKIVLTALLKLAFKDELNESSYNKIDDVSSYKKNKDYYYDDRGMSGFRPIGKGSKRGYVDRKGTARLFIAKGKKDSMSPRKLVEFIQKETGVSQDKIDDVKIMDSFSFFAAPFGDVEKILNVFQNKSRGNGNRSLVSRAKDKKN